MFYLSVATIFFIVAFISQIVVSSISIHWAIDPFIIFEHAFPFQVAFGLSIPIACAYTTLFCLLLIDSRSKMYLYLLTSLVIINSAMLIGLTSPPSLSSWIDKWDKKWTNTSHSMSFQLEKSCCGWKNFQDRSIINCPFLSKSGCMPIVEGWINMKYHQVFEIELLISSLFLYSLLSFFLARYCHKIEAIWAEIEIPFLPSDLYL
ncbi:hypothetical protein M9Y10_007579 [Tritrichomonas musculus]|uniref:Tetraspanin family protein n=1 Tax=Tritrichomonas musculus TaxID=1915356 RepID=A0ABR2J248_9EUKA